MRSCKVAAVAVNPIDTYIRSGRGDDAVAAPIHHRCDVAGTIDSLGPEADASSRGTASGFQPGMLAGRYVRGICLRCRGMAYPIPLAFLTRCRAVALTALTVPSNVSTWRFARVMKSSRHGGTGGVVLWLCRWRKRRARVIKPSDPMRRPRSVALGAIRPLIQAEDSPKAFASYRRQGVNVWYETQREPDVVRQPWISWPVAAELSSWRPTGATGLPWPFLRQRFSAARFPHFNTASGRTTALCDDINRWLGRRS